MYSMSFPMCILPSNTHTHPCYYDVLLYTATSRFTPLVFSVDEMTGSHRCPSKRALFSAKWKK